MRMLFAIESCVLTKFIVDWGSFFFLLNINNINNCIATICMPRIRHIGGIVEIGTEKYYGYTDAVLYIKGQS